MRDLANLNFSQGRSSSKFKTVGRFLIILVVLLGVAFFLKSRFIASGPGSPSIVLQEAPRGLVPVDANQASKVVEGGVDLATQKATLGDVKYGGEASGIATRTYGGGTYQLSIDATIPDPKGNSYGVWLTGGGTIVFIDYLRGSKTSWSFSFRDTDKYSKYDGILITLERTKEDNEPEERVLEGSW